MSPVFISPDVEVYGLAKRQAEALALSLEGYSSKETAQLMNVSHRTVEMTMKLVMERLGARNRLHLIKLAVQCGALVIKEGAEVAKNGAACIALCFFLIFATTPSSNNNPDDLMRLTARTVRVRRNRDDFLQLSTTPDEDDA